MKKYLGLILLSLAAAPLGMLTARAQTGVDTSSPLRKIPSLFSGPRS